MFNPSMNNVEAIDYDNHEWFTDSDGVVGRWFQEFPRMSPDFVTKTDPKKPWGIKSDPVYFDHW